LTLSRQGDHAVRAMVWLAGQPTEGRRKAAEIAEAVGIPPAFAARVLAQLNRAGLLDARAGSVGGYALARPAASISLLEVIEAAEGPLLARGCILRDQPCGTDGYCVLHEAWQASQNALRAVLAETPLVSDPARRAATTAA
jgi:Rrf2 family protein